ncbi:hypothetical protein F5Y04DRAFT_233773 [Hypomontagnella monticulosa]|nr:hypothetical protein F5Y04DRAFT_233773 [Hypomontagnella monticulosa]
MMPEDDAPPAYSRYPDQDPSAAAVPDGRSPNANTPSTPAPALPPRSQPTSPQTSFPSPSTPQKFPVSWTLYRGPGSGTLLLKADSSNGPSPPLFAVSQTPNPSAGQPNLTLHEGPSTDAPALATGERHKTFTGGIHSVISLPGSGSGISPEEPLRTLVSWPHISYAFDVDVGTADPSGKNLGRLRRETFEWRHSAGSAITWLGAASTGWKLLRLSADPPPGLKTEEWSFTGGGEFSSDGKEIVAVWADARRSQGPDGCMKFKFLGTGASGVLGERWTVMAVMSALRMWQQGEIARR